jgi:6-pyruvoyltetrahydropterin/6-carboxytetrahydropterin synthase
MNRQPTTTITKLYHFEAGHYLPKVPKGHKCERQHGHNYVLQIKVRLPDGVVQENGFVVDFWDLDAIVNPIVAVVDHRNLNDIPGLENPTAELIALWFLNQLISHDVVAVRVYETPECWAEVEA